MKTTPTAAPNSNDRLLARTVELSRLVKIWTADHLKAERVACGRITRAVLQAMTIVLDSPKSGDARKYGRALHTVLSRCETAFIYLEDLLAPASLEEAFRRIAQLKSAALRLREGQPVEEVRLPAPDAPEIKERVRTVLTVLATTRKNIAQVKAPSAPPESSREQAAASSLSSDPSPTKEAA